MKRTLLFILCGLLLSISVSGCKQKQDVYRIITPVDGLHWGMNGKDVVSVLNLTDDDKAIDKNGLVSFITRKKYNLYGASVNLHIGIYDDMLTSIIAKISEEDLDTVEEELTDELGKGQYTYSVNADSSVKDVSSIVWQDMLLKDKPEYFNRIKKVYSKSGLDTSERFSKNLGNRSLITYELILDKKSAKYALLTIEGALATFLNYPDKANKKIE